MYFWKIAQLKKQLSSHGLTEKQVFYYILIDVAFTAIVLEVMGYFPPQESPDVWAYVGSVINVIIPIAGTILAFRANGGASGVQFPARYFSIGLVATLRFVVLLIPLMAVMMIYWFFVPEAEGTGVEVALLSAWYILLYVYIARQVREVAVAGSSPDASVAPAA